MAGHTEVLSTLRERGYRLTPQRAMIFTVLAEQEGPVEAEEIYEAVRRQYPYIDLATIYRTLKLLKDLHLVTEISTGRVTRYELVKERHHHLVCRRCGRVIDLPLEYLQPLSQALERDLGFAPDLEHFSLTGQCQRCRQGGK